MINLFVTQATDSEYQPAKLNSVQGYNILGWRAHGLEFFAISDLNAEELKEFGDTFTAGFNRGTT